MIKRLTPEDIEEINSQVYTQEEGIFSEPYGIPVHIKEPVVYMRWETGGYSGGSCWGDRPSWYETGGKPDFRIVDLVLKKLRPSITYMEFNGIKNLMHTNEETEHEYYGNSTDYKIEYCILSELEDYIANLDN